MEHVIEMRELDQWIWSELQDSLHPQDMIDFVAHAKGREAPIEQALDRAAELQHPGDEQALAPQVLQRIEAWAQEGQASAILAAWRWRSMGLGGVADEARASHWLAHGVALGHGACLTLKARQVLETDNAQGLALLEQAVAAGDLSAHAWWQGEDVDAVMAHTQLAMQAKIPKAAFFEARRLLARDDDEAKAIGRSLLRTAAEAGDTDACLGIGVMFWKGLDGAEQDLDTASQWLLKGARLGCSHSMTALGLVLRDLGRHAEVRRYLTWAALMGDMQGQYSLGRMLILDGASPEDHAEGIHWARQSAGKGHLPAVRMLGWALYHGQGCTMDAQEAVMWLGKGAERGDAECQSSLACAYATGKGVAEDPQRAHELFHLASLQGNAYATAMLGQTYVDGHGTPVDVQRAIECFKVAAAQKESAAALGLGRIYLFGKGVPRDHAAAARWLRDAAHWGSTSAKLYLGMMLLHGEGVEENPKAAVRWLREAAQEGDSDAMRVLGNVLLEGQGVDADPDEGRRLMIKAAALGDKEANDWVEKNCPEQPQWLRDLVQGKTQGPAMEDGTGSA